MENKKNDFAYPPKILVTKIGLDGHDRGSRIVVAYLRDAGMEVVYTSPWQKIEAVVRLALEEDVDVIGISSLATDHLIIPQLIDSLRDANLGHIKVVVGGIIPAEEQPALLKAGVSQVFHPGSSREEIVETFKQLTKETRIESPLTGAML